MFFRRYLGAILFSFLWSGRCDAVCRIFLLANIIFCACYSRHSTLYLMGTHGRYHDLAFFAATAVGLSQELVKFPRPYRRSAFVLLVRINGVLSDYF